MRLEDDREFQERPIKVLVFGGVVSTLPRAEAQRKIRRLLDSGYSLDDIDLVDAETDRFVSFMVPESV